MLDPSSTVRLTPHSLKHFPQDTLFHRVARAVCMAGVLPRKELFESWEVARHTRRRFRGGRVVDLACGHGLLAHLMVLLDDTTPSALAVDVRIPPSAAKVAQSLCQAWPRLQGRVTFLEARLQDVPLSPQDLVVSAHACGGLTDVILQRAASARARVSVLPCCHALRPSRVSDLEGWTDGSLAMDLERAVQLRAQGYAIHTRHISSAVTPKNRMLLGEPRADDAHPDPAATVTS